MRQQSNKPNVVAKRRAMVLIVVLVVVMMLSLAAYTYVALMRSHRESSVQTNRQLQAKLMVDSGADYVRVFLLQGLDAQLEAGGRYNNPSFKQLPIIDDLDPRHRGYFTIVAPALDDEGNLAGIRYGLEDESGRLNLNTLLIFEKQMGGAPATGGGATAPGAGATTDAAGATGSAGGAAQPAASGAASALQSAAASALLGGSAAGESDSPARELLMALPGMTEPVADSILDWLDEDDEAREYGAESAYYATLEPAYACKNGPLDTVEELLRVRGVTPELLLGTDTNRNGQIDQNEMAAGSQALAFGPGAMAPTAGFGTTATDAAMPSGSLDRGWAAYLTLHSRERNLTPDGQPRVYLNNPDLEMLHTELLQVFPEEWANFIVAYRQGGRYTAAPNSNTPLESAAGRKIDFQLKSKTNFTQALDLVGAMTRVKFAEEDQAVVVEGPFKSGIGPMNGYMAMLMDHVTVNPAASVPGRININQAPAALLRGIPGMESAVVDQILSARTPELEPEKPNRRHETWLLTEGIVDLTTMKLLQPFVTSSGHVYRAQVVGYFQSGQAAARSEAIFDATGLLPRVVLWREMSHLGRGYALETLGIDYTE